VYVDFTEEQEALRRRLRAYYRELLTPELRAELASEEDGGAGGTAYRRVVRQMGADGWLGVGWPE
jgi:alkylation response protein AidB-like acyl-CoA dehydrogenase